MYKLTNQQKTPTKKTTVFNRTRTPLGEKSPNAFVGLSPVKFADSTQKQVKSDQEFARRLQNSIDDDATQFQVSAFSVLMISLRLRLTGHYSSNRRSRNQFKELLILILCQESRKCW